MERNPKLEELRLRLIHTFPDLLIVHREDLPIDERDEWGPGDYLIISDKFEDKEILSGAYSIKMEEENICMNYQPEYIMVWLPYPELKKGEFTIFKTLHDHVNNYYNG